MTILIGTITERTGWLTQNTLCIESRSNPEPLAMFPKVLMLPHMQMISGGYGDARMFCNWQSFLCANGQYRNIDCIIENSRNYLTNMAKTFLGDMPFIAVIMGWSLERQRITGYVYQSENGFEPQELSMGHIIHPMEFDTTSQDFSRCWQGAANGQQVDEFHTEVGKRQFQSAENGILPDYSCLGGQLIRVKITKDAMEARVLHEFPDYETNLSILKSKVLGTPLVSQTTKAG
tara:strand:- start:220 stop:918 length:699 start_codon:yes stop_codon:yes gene_type:complete